MRSLVTGLALLGLGVLAGCGTPQEQCINRSTRELRTVEQLLAEVEGNLARGYAWEEYEIERSRWEVCGYDTITKPNGKVVEKPRMCLEDYSDTVRRRVAIDPVAEARKRDGLIAQRKRLLAQAEANIKACKAAYPE